MLAAPAVGRRAGELALWVRAQRITDNTYYIGYQLDRPGLGTTPITAQCDPADARYGKGQCKLTANDYARLPADVFTKSRIAMLLLGP